MLTVASTPSPGCDAQCVQVVGGHAPVDQVHAGEALCSCDVCARMRWLDAGWGVAMCRIIVSFARVYHVNFFFGFSRSALLLAVVLCWVDCCFDSCTCVLLG